MSLDIKDKAILRTMLREKCEGRSLSTLVIAKKTEINWKTAYNHLLRLGEYGYVKQKETGKIRTYKRKGKLIEARRRMLWRLNVRK